MSIFIPEPAAAHLWCQQQRDNGKTIGYVPTMGALHQGHLTLLQRAVKENQHTCVSIFVNPLQFNNQQDLEKYPRSMESDLKLLTAAGCDMVFSGSLKTFFPEVSDFDQMPALIPLPAIAGLEAEFRPGHLEGVQAIVERLFATVGKCRAYFGEKDFQQTLLVRQIAQALGEVEVEAEAEVEVVVCPTVREPSGLAMSSRNERLSTRQRTMASQIYRALLSANDAWNQGERDPWNLESIMKSALNLTEIQLEYAAVRDPNHWTADTPPGPVSTAQGLIAAWIGEVRLIDNMRLGTHEDPTDTQ